jgi:hypothetical protein
MSQVSQVTIGSTETIQRNEKVLLMRPKAYFSSVQAPFPQNMHNTFIFGLGQTQTAQNLVVETD